ncbi:MAG: RNA polymerase sigma factor [Flavobacteriia bacterium]|nr:RNA polymerase sigma factor [Flavobacteriia bacterium]
MSLKNTIHISPLIQDCLANKQAAQFELYLQYHKAMYNTALRIVRDEMLAEDVMQESFISAFQKLHQFSGLVSFGAWLKKIVINKAIVAYRKQQKERSSSVSDLPLTSDSPLDDASSLAVEKSDKKKAAWILQTIDGLKENYRQSLQLHLVEGLTHQEVTEVLGISEANCRTTFSRAKAQLRKKLEQDPIWKTL